MFRHRFLSSFAVVAMLCSAVPAVAEDRLFGDLSTESLQSLPSRGSGDAPLPSRFRALEVDIDALEHLLFQAPAEGSAAAAPLVIALPYPDGTDRRFLVEESPILEPALAASLPEIRTFVAKGIDDPTATARLSLTSLGFHAMVLSASGTVFIDPYRRWDARYALSYFKRDAVKPAGESFRCDTMNESPEENLVEEAFPVALPASSTGTQLRTYRLALASTFEYSAAVCPPNMVEVSCVQNAMVASINRVNLIYEREVAIRMVMVANNDIIYIDDPNDSSDDDPYDNANTALVIAQNQIILDRKIGTANYDIGHVFSTVDGSLALPESTCDEDIKAQGVSGQPHPVGAPFDVGYVAHEMGHQFGASHTFNGTTGSCRGRNDGTAYEPGSGTTIMGYAGLCDAENIEQHASDTFHTESFDEIVAFSTDATRRRCGVKTPTGNMPPTVDAGPAFTIPKQTPFTLTGSATDPDGDTLTYMWEEFDLGTASPPSNDVAAVRPIFRSFVPLRVPNRTFPQISDILNNVATFGESMPTRDRKMTFRLTARDNHMDGGGVDYASTTVTVNAAAGPFAVTRPNTALSWLGLSLQVVTWNVARTTAAPVSCANVAIHLSTDGGITFPTTLAASTANDGTERVTIPNTPTIKARVRVSCVGNIFFDISNANFTILAVPTLKSITPTSGDSAGGTRVTLTGTNFLSGARVVFGGVAAPTVTFNGPTSLTAVTPAHSTGPVDVNVFNPNRTSTTFSAAFTYLPPTFLQLPRTVTTSASPSAIELIGKTYVFYKGSGNDSGIYVASANGSIYPGSWTTKRLPSAINTSAAPSVARRGLEIYVVYKGAGSDTNIYVARSVDATATWTTTRFPREVNTSTGPEAYFDLFNQLWVFYKGAGNDQRMFAARLPDNAVWSLTAAGTGPMVFKPSGNNTVPGLLGYDFQLPSTVNTSATPSAIRFSLGGPLRPYVFYKGVAGDSRIWLIISEDGLITPPATWTQKHLPSAIGTSAAPSVVVNGRGIYVVYKGAGGDATIYVARSLDGTATWSTTHFSTDVSTSAGPTAFVSGGKLYVFYKGFVDEQIYVARLPDDAIWTPVSQPAIP